MAENLHSTPHTPWDTSWHLSAELARVLENLSRYLERQRERGRTPAGDAVRGLVIEEGEAEGLIASLAEDLNGGPKPGGAPPPRRVDDEIADRSAQGAAQGSFLPLQHVRKVFDLRPEEYDALLVALAVEVDARFGRIVAYLNDHVSRTRPTLGLALALAGLDSTRPLSPVGFTDRPIVRDGLLEVEGDAPLPGLALKIPRDLVARLTGADADVDEPWLAVRRPDTGLLDRLVLDPQVARQLIVWSDGLRATRSTPPLIVAGAPGNGRATAGCAAFFRAGLTVVQVDIAPESAAERLRTARREARWHDAALLVRPTASPQQPWEWARAVARARREPAGGTGAQRRSGVGCRSGSAGGAGAGCARRARCRAARTAVAPTAASRQRDRRVRDRPSWRRGSPSVPAGSRDRSAARWPISLFGRQANGGSMARRSWPRPARGLSHDRSARAEDGAPPPRAAISSCRPKWRRNSTSRSRGSVIAIGSCMNGASSDG